MPTSGPSWLELLSLMNKGPLDVLAAQAPDPVHSGLEPPAPVSGELGEPLVHSGLEPPAPVSGELGEPLVHSGLSQQITKPTTDDINQMKELGENAAAAQDEIAAILDPINKQVQALKDKLMAEIAAHLEDLEVDLDKNSDELLKKMLSHGLKAIRVTDRPPIEVVTSKTKSLTQKELLRILGKPEGIRVWNQIHVNEKHSLKIPDPTPPDA